MALDVAQASSRPPQRIGTLPRPNPGLSGLTLSITRVVVSDERPSDNGGHGRWRIDVVVLSGGATTLAETARSRSVSLVRVLWAKPADGSA